MPGSRARKAMEKVTGIASQRVLPPYAKTRFSTWWKKRTALRAPAEAKPGSALLFPTCLVEYQSPQVGKDLVRVLERNGIASADPAGQVCRVVPWLHTGGSGVFRKQGRKNVTVVACAVPARPCRGDKPGGKGRGTR